jgi:hypothetical protein
MNALLHRRNIASGLAAAALLAAGVQMTHAEVRDAQANAAWCADRCDQIVVDWNATAYQVIKSADGYADPLVASRALAMMHLAMHDAVNAVRPRYASWHFGERDAEADAAIAAAAAAHDVLARLYPAQHAIVKAELDKSVVEAGIAASTARGVTLGKRAAEAVLQKRAGDGSARIVPYKQGSRAGEYRFTPGFDFVAHPQWRHVEPFTLKTPSQFRNEPPPALSSARYAVDFDEVKSVGRKGTGAKRSVDETHYAAFWYEFSDIGWNRIARAASRTERQDLWQRARTFAMLNAVMADAYIAGWDSKLHYDFWRPITAIRMADTDGNAATAPDPTYEPLLTTPPVQDYPSTHSALGAAAAVALAESFGRDDVAFAFSSTSALPANPVRSFASFSQAARENADSRVKAGIHFRSATTAGLKLGEDIGRHAVRNVLVPLEVTQSAAAGVR